MLVSFQFEWIFETNGYFEVDFQDNSIKKIQVISTLASRIWLKKMFKVVKYISWYTNIQNCTAYE